jgi:hypothetical protein
MPDALGDVRALDLCSHLSHPNCAVRFGSLGADVIEVECLSCCGTEIEAAMGSEPKAVDLTSPSPPLLGQFWDRES